MIIIENNGKQVVELCEIYLGCGISQFAIKRGGVMHCISAERFDGILVAARQNGFGVFDCRF